MDPEQHDANYDYQMEQLQKRQDELAARLYTSAQLGGWFAYPWTDAPISQALQPWRDAGEPLVSKSVAAYLAEWFAQ